MEAFGSHQISDDVACVRVAVSDGHGLNGRAISVNVFPVCFPGEILHQRPVFIYLAAESSDCVLRAVKQQLHYFRAQSSLNKSSLIMKGITHSDGAEQEIGFADVGHNRLMCL